MIRVIRKPVLTEKSLQEATEGKFTFEVDLKANKNQIASEIKKAFKVDVQSVRTRILKGKRRRIRGTFRQKEASVLKRATVKLAEGQKINVFETG